MTLLVFFLGLAALVAGAELLVRGASRLALSFGVSPLVVGLTVVAFGTSAPEVAVSVGAALGGNPDVAVGNVVGSNIFNVLFILGASALITPLTVHVQIVRQEVPVMIGASVLLTVLALDGSLGRGEAGALLLLLIAYTAYLLVQARRAGAASGAAPAAETRPAGGHWGIHVLSIAAGLGLLVLGAEGLVGAASSFARALGISDRVIGLTIVAAGTSLPEVATSLMAAVRGQREIAIGNVVGSNTFNILGCLGATGLVASGGLPIGPGALSLDLWVMLAVAVACVPVVLTGRRIVRWEGALFLVHYALYTTYLVLDATGSAVLPSMRTAMLLFVLPLTALTLVASLLRSGSPETRSSA